MNLELILLSLALIITLTSFISVVLSRSGSDKTGISPYYEKEKQQEKEFFESMVDYRKFIGTVVLPTTALEYQNKDILNWINLVIKKDVAKKDWLSQMPKEALRELETFLLHNYILEDDEQDKIRKTLRLLWEVFPIRKRAK